MFAEMATKCFGSKFESTVNMARTAAFGLFSGTEGAFKETRRAIYVKCRLLCCLKHD